MILGSRDMEIVRTTPSSIKFEHQGATFKLLGESFLRGFGSPDFVIHRTSCSRLDENGEERDVDPVVRDALVDMVLAELRSRGWMIEAE